MALRPVSLQVTSSTTVEISFNKDLSNLIGIDNFDILSVSGINDSILIEEVFVSNTSVILTTRPHNQENLYTITLKDGTNKFLANDGDRLVNDDISRVLYFVGFDSFNPVRDRMLLSVPKTYSIEGSLVRNLISNNAEELYTIQKNIGEVLSDNYISIRSENEQRIRSSGAKDRLANENAYMVEYVSRYRNGENLIFGEILANSSSPVPSQKVISDFPISLQQTLKTETFTFSNLEKNISGYLLNLSNNNVIKLESLTVTKAATEECEEASYYYNIDGFKYSILDNRYDPDRAYSYFGLDSNQILLSESSGFAMPSAGDTVTISYLYKDLSKNISTDSIEVFSIESTDSEVIPQNISRFFLKNAPITDSAGDILSFGNITFKSLSQYIETPFQTEIQFSTSKLPSNYGEYSVNYSTGEVIVYGTTSAVGTGFGQYTAEYTYRRQFKANLDYFLSSYDFVATSGRDLVTSEAVIRFTYQQIFVDGVDYKSECHIEILNEEVASNVTSSFSLKTKNSPITKVFNITNQTTGEIYKPIYASKSEVFFSAINPPRFVSHKNKVARFEISQDEKISPYFKFVSPISKFKVTNNDSINNIQISPPIQSHLVDTTSSQYVLKTASGDLQNMNVKFFGAPDGSGNINYIALTATSDVPDLSKEYYIGLISLSVNLENKYILNEQEDSIGSLTSSSLSLDKEIFITEKQFATDYDYYKAVNNHVSTDDISSSFNSALSRLQNIGDYVVDYKGGIIHVAVGNTFDIDLGRATYTYSKISSGGLNIITSDGTYKKKNYIDSSSSVISFEKTKVENGILIEDLNESLELPGDGYIILDDGTTVSTCTITADYGFYTKWNPTAVTGVFTLPDLFGRTSQVESYRVSPGIYSELTTSKEFGGRNICPTGVALTRNFVDLKTYHTSKARLSSGYTFRVYDEFFGFIYNITNATTGVDLTDEAMLSYVDGYLEVYIPEESSLITGDDITITYVKNYIPVEGTRIAVNYASGSIFYNYTEVLDSLFISYEYGDNELNWQINNSISEGERYYITYKYGALRDALKNNFGILTKIPFFTKFTPMTDRELYRKALQGTIESFARGPTRESFDNLIRKFTDQSPEITESGFGEWILGRDFLNPSELSYSGKLTFESGKFDSGVVIAGDTSIKAPAATSLNVNEGTFSCWIRNDWYGIDNDANISFDFSSMGKISYSLILNQDIFKKDNFELFASNNRSGFIDWTGKSITLVNYSNVLDNTVVGPYGITKYHNRLTPFKKSSHEFTLKAEMLDSSEYLVDFYEKITSLSERLSGLGIPSFSSAMGASSRGFLTLNLEILLSYYSSPLTISIGDDSKVFFAIGTFIPVKNPTTGRVQVFSLDEVEVTQNTMPNYDGPFEIMNCNCIEYSDFESLEAFNDPTFNSAKITLDDNIDISYLLDEYDVISTELSGLKFISNNGMIYSVLSLLDADGSEFNDLSESTIVSGFIVNKIPDNAKYITALGSEAINSALPSGSGALLFTAISVITEASDSVTKYGYSNLPKLVDFTSKNLYISVDRDPVSNLVVYKLNDTTKTMVYSDLISAGNYSQVFSILNLDSWFASESEFVSEIDGISDLDNKMFIGTLDPLSKSRINIFGIKYSIEELLNPSDIFIGSTLTNPNSLKFTLNKVDENVSGIGTINTSNKSVYIWLDNDCMVDGNMVGSWRVRTIIPNQKSIPDGVDGYGNTTYSTSEKLDYIEGSITTDGVYSYAKSKSPDIECSYEGCSGSYRFCGQDLLEENGWKLITESGSDLINVTIGGMQTNSTSWRKVGDFSSSIQNNIYVVNNISSYDYLYLPLNCIETANYAISFKVASFDESIIGSDSGYFGGAISGNMIGLNIAEIYDGSKYIKLSLAASESGKYIAVIDGSDNSVLDIFAFDWYNLSYNELRISIDQSTEIITIYALDTIRSRIKYSALNDYTATCDNYLEKGIYLRLVDKDLTSDSFFESFDSIQMSVDLIELSLSSKSVVENTEDSDILTISNNKIDFKFYNKADGYMDSYGYMEQGSDVDDIVFVSDREKYIFDSGESESKNRMSIFKDGYGYLNFRIYDSMYPNFKSSYYNISSSIKSFEPGEFHHIAASWRLNTDYSRDELHLFVDGKEVPSLYKFGGFIPSNFNSMVGDVAKEVVQDFSKTKINFNSTFSDGVVLAGSSILSSASALFTVSDIGRSIIFTNPSLALELKDKAFVIIGVDGSDAIIGDIDTLSEYSFTTSESGLEFRYPPYISASTLSTELSTTKYELYRTTCTNITGELGGIQYTVVDGVITVLDNKNIKNNYRANITNGYVEFLTKNNDCSWSQSVDVSDLDIWIETFGLTKTKVSEKIQYSSKSALGTEYLDGLSGFITNLPEPIDLESVSIKRILLDNTIPDGSIDTNVFSFSVDILNGDTSSLFGTTNNGRFITLNFETDNIKFCLDGYTASNYITISGEGSSGSISETVYLTDSKEYNLENLYLSISNISGSFEIVDVYSEPCMISLYETNSIFEDDSSSSLPKLSEYSNGVFFFNDKENQEENFVLPAGIYKFDYAAYLRIRMPNIGKYLHLGSDFNNQNKLNGLMDEAKIVTEMSGDTRSYEYSSLFSRSITEEFISKNKPCTDLQTIFLTHFDDPEEMQLRRLRNKIFLNEKDNFKYKLSKSDIEILSPYLNDKLMFVSTMIRMGYSEAIADETFVETHYADGGPLFNEARYKHNNELVVGFNSVNEGFGNSAKFFESKPEVYSAPNVINKISGTIEFWISPLLSTKTDNSKRVLFDSYYIKTAFVTPTTTNIIELPEAASKIVSVKLPQQKDSKIYATSRYDEVERSATTGKLYGGTGVDNDFSVGSKLKSDGTIIVLKTNLISTDPVLVRYISKDSYGSRIQIFLENNKIFFNISSEEATYSVYSDTNWSTNTWHRVCASWKANSGRDYLKLVVDGSSTDTSVLNGTVSIKDELQTVNIGAQYDGMMSAMSRLDNFRISNIDRNKLVDTSGKYIDFNYSSNLNTVSKIYKDINTTYINNFDKNSDSSTYVTLTDYKNGIFDFDIDIADDFGLIKSEEVEDLIVFLVNKLKPSHTNVLVRFKRKTC
jgi:hypothetical protein